MVGVSASVNLPLHKVQKFSSGAGSPGWKNGHKMVVVVVVVWWMVAVRGTV